MSEMDGWGKSKLSQRKDHKGTLLVSCIGNLRHTCHVYLAAVIAFGGKCVDGARGTISHYM